MFTLISNFKLKCTDIQQELINFKYFKAERNILDGMQSADRILALHMPFSAHGPHVMNHCPKLSPSPGSER